MHMLGYAEKVIAFEPRPDAAAALQELVNGSPVVVHAVAVSDHNGEATLRMPEMCGLSTIESSNPIAGAAITVPVRTLDSYKLAPVRLIKIDVEGHEEAVLRGATKTLEAHRPALIVEVEERHSPGNTNRVPEWLAQFGYRRIDDGTTNNMVFRC
jgi:FkbM family methyltransferase